MNPELFFSRAAVLMQRAPIRQIGVVATPPPDAISLAVGYPSPDGFPWDEIAASAARLLSTRGGQVLQYLPTHGHAPLLEAGTELLAKRGVMVTPEQLLIVNGAQQGIDLVARTLLDPGDVVLVESPSYAGALSALGNAMVMLVGVRQTPDGIDLADLDRALWRVRQQGRRVKLLYVVPNFNNPTGALTSRATRRGVLERAVRDDFLILEDDPYGDLYFESVTAAEETRAIKVEDEDGRVIYVTSVSKTLGPAMRIAWIAAARPFAALFEAAKQGADLCASAFTQQIVLDLLRNGTLERRLPALRALYERKWRVMSAALRQEHDSSLTWSEPRGGFFVWARLPAGLDVHELAVVACSHGVVFVPGTAFFADGSGQEWLRLAFSLVPEESIAIGIRKLGTAIGTMREASGSRGRRAGERVR